VSQEIHQKMVAASAILRNATFMAARAKGAKAVVFLKEFEAWAAELAEFLKSLVALNMFLSDAGSGHIMEAGAYTEALNQKSKDDYSKFVTFLVSFSAGIQGVTAKIEVLKKAKKDVLISMTSPKLTKLLTNVKDTLCAALSQLLETACDEFKGGLLDSSDTFQQALGRFDITKAFLPRYTDLHAIDIGILKEGVSVKAGVVKYKLYKALAVILQDDEAIKRSEVQVTLAKLRIDCVSTLVAIRTFQFEWKGIDISNRGMLEKYAQCVLGTAVRPCVDGAVAAAEVSRKFSGSLGVRDSALLQMAMEFIGQALIGPAYDLILEAAQAICDIARKQLAPNWETAVSNKDAKVCFLIIACSGSALEVRTMQKNSGEPLPTSMVRSASKRINPKAALN
jgi:hypothetical protein